MILLNTPHGIYNLEYDELSHLTLREFLYINKIPYNSVSLYIETSEGNFENYIGLENKVDDVLKGCLSIMIRTDRNIDLGSMISKSIIIENVHGKVNTAEYIFDDLGAETQQIYKQFTKEECREYVDACVKEFISETDIDFSKPLVFGISGGGDSNTLPEAFINNGFPKENIIPVMIKGIPDLDKGLSRARLVCERQGIELIEIPAEKIDELLGRNKRDGSWAVDFEEKYPNGDLEIIGTLAVRLGLTYAKDKYDAQGCVTGLNLEDILSESFLAILKGEFPPAFPKRVFDKTSFYYPLYKIPKKILDGCHPKLSLDNYNERFPNNMYWRTLPYYFTQSLSTNIPGIEFRLIDGFKELANKQNNFITYKKDEKIGFVVEGEIDENTRRMWKEFIEAK